jgi:hypothetical protein
MRFNNLKKIGISSYFFLFPYLSNYFFIIASIAAKEPLSFSLIIIYNSSPGVHLKNVTAA